MSGKHRHWHRRWTREGRRLVHDSGLVMEPVADGTGAQYSPALDSLSAWERHERARGVTTDRNLDARLSRLLREAETYE